MAFKSSDWVSTCLYFEFPSYHELADDTYNKKSHPNKKEKLILGKYSGQGKYWGYEERNHLIQSEISKAVIRYTYLEGKDHHKNR